MKANMNKKKNPYMETPKEFQKRIDKELKYKLEYVMKMMRSEEERQLLLNAIRQYVNLLDEVQSLDHYVRLYYWQGAFHIFDYLRQSDALGRQSDGFSEHVKNTIIEKSKKAYVYAER